MRRTEAALIDRKTKNLRVVQQSERPVGDHLLKVADRPEAVMHIDRIVFR
jgi:hypothetical protein